MSKPPYRGRKAASLKLTTADQGSEPLRRHVRTLYEVDATRATLALALIGAALEEAAAIENPHEREAVMGIIHMRAYDAAHGPQP